MKHHAQVNIPDAAAPGTIREYRMRVSDVWVAGGAQHVRLVAVDAPEVCVDTVIADPAAYLQMGEECLIKMTIGAPIPDDALS
jgi:hypothetical protein